MILIAMLLGYLIGSIPTAFIFGKLYKGIDIRQHGSGNVGATNVFRVLGKIPGIIVLLIDVSKGFVVIVFVSQLLGLNRNIHLILLALSVVSGHNWTIFLKFKGGKGIATSLGVLIGLTVKIVAFRPVLYVTLGVWLVIFIISGIVSLSSIIASVIMPIAMVVTSQPFEICLLGAIFCIWVVFRHKSNIKRLLSGQEQKVRFSMFRSKLLK